jgi:integrase
MPLDAITYDTVESYIATKLAEGERIREAAALGKPPKEEITDSIGRRRMRPLQPLSPRTINMTVVLLSQVMGVAVERELIVRNPAKGKGRRVKERKPSKPYLENAEQIEALLRAAGELDREATRERAHLCRRGMLATITFGGLRVGEICSLRWSEVDLPSRWLRVSERTGKKTDASARNVKIRRALLDELLAVRARTEVDQNAYVFPTRTGRRQSEDKVRTMLGNAVKRANANLAEAGLPPLGLTTKTHRLRDTFASVLYALGEPPPVVMAEMGHTSPALALRIYAKAMRLSEDEKARLKALVEAGVWANMGERADLATPERSEVTAA